MKVAVPYLDGKVNPAFGRSEYFKFMTLRTAKSSLQQSLTTAAMSIPDSSRIWKTTAWRSHWSGTSVSTAQTHLQKPELNCIPAILMMRIQLSANIWTALWNSKKRSEGAVLPDDHLYDSSAFISINRAGDTRRIKQNNDKAPRVMKRQLRSIDFTWGDLRNMITYLICIQLKVKAWI